MRRKVEDHGRSGVLCSWPEWITRVLQRVKVINFLLLFRTDESRSSPTSYVDKLTGGKLIGKSNENGGKKEKGPRPEYGRN